MIYRLIYSHLFFVFLFILTIHNCYSNDDNKGRYFIDFYYQINKLGELSYNINDYYAAKIIEGKIDDDNIDTSFLGIGYDIGYMTNIKFIFFDYLKIGYTKYFNTPLKSESSNLFTDDDILVELKKYQNIFLGINFQTGLTIKQFMPFVGTSIGLQYNRLTFKSDRVNSGSEVMSSLPFAFDIRLGTYYDTGKSFSPFILYKVCMSTSSKFSNIPVFSETDGSYNANVDFILNKSVNHYFSIGLQYFFN